MSVPFFSGCWAKVDRARENIDALEASTKALAERHPYTTFVEDYTETGWNIVGIYAESPPVRLGAIAGDVIHDLRSAFDYLAWDLVIAHGSQPGRWTQFPIYAAKPDFEASVEHPGPNRKSPLEGIPKSSPTWAHIEYLQPYNRRDPDADRLLCINQLANADKHHALYTGLGFADGAEILRNIGWNPNASLQERIVLLPSTGPLPLKDKTEIMRLRFDPNGLPPQVHVQSQQTATITFGDGERQMDFLFLDTLRGYVAKILTEFLAML